MPAERQNRADPGSRGLVTLPRLSFYMARAGACVLFLLLLLPIVCWRSTRKLIPRFPVVRILVDPVEQLLASRLFALGR
jgi:hypothetical protein